MKKRSDFITNSSSSSFVVYFDCGEYNEKTVDTKEELDKYYIYNYGNDDDTIEILLEEEGEWIQKLYNKHLEQIQRGRRIYFGSISNDDYYTDIQNLMQAIGCDFEWEDD